jgi:hypothetical protein
VVSEKSASHTSRSFVPGGGQGGRVRRLMHSLAEWSLPQRAGAHTEDLATTGLRQERPRRGAGCNRGEARTALRGEMRWTRSRH